MELIDGWDFTSDEIIHDVLADLRTEFKEKHNMKPKETMWAVRAAITGRTKGCRYGKNNDNFRQRYLQTQDSKSIRNLKTV